MSNDNFKPIIQELDFGKIVVNLDKLMKDKNVTPYRLNAESHIRYKTIQNLQKDIATRIDFNVLARLCYSLDCKVSDILEYVPNDK